MKKLANHSTTGLTENLAIFFSCKREISTTERKRIVWQPMLE